jgi:hypothetical protein
MIFKQRAMAGLVKRLALIIFLLLVGLKGGGLALSQDGPLQLDGDRLTGHLSQVPLRIVLEQLQKQLGIIYEVPAGELDTVISVDLEQEPIVPALGKILAPWDYAFTMNAGGHLRFLYITPKAAPVEAVSGSSEASDVKPSKALAERGLSPLKQSEPVRGAGEIDRSLSNERKPDSTSPPPSSAFASPPAKIPGLRAPAEGVPMAIQQVPPGTTMPMLPASGIGGMQVTPPANPSDMPIIPATAYPPMDIQPVPDYLQEEMLRNIQP